MRRCSLVAVTVASTVCVAGYGIIAAQGRPAIPRTWDDQEIARHEVPLADPSGSPKHVSSDYYYRIPVRPIYKAYRVYAPGREPAGYLDRLKQENPASSGREHAPRLDTDGDWCAR